MAPRPPATGHSQNEVPPLSRFASNCSLRAMSYDDPTLLHGGTEKSTPSQECRVCHHGATATRIVKRFAGQQRMPPPDPGPAGGPKHPKRGHFERRGQRSGRNTVYDADGVASLAGTGRHWPALATAGGCYLPGVASLFASQCSKRFRRSNYRSGLSTKSLLEPA